MNDFVSDTKDKQILDAVSKGFVSVSQLSSRLFMSEATVRRRLNALEKNGLVIRTHGGAIPSPESKNPPLASRTLKFNDKKEKIAEEAVALMEDGYMVFADSSSTVQYLLPKLSRFKDITVCTNSLCAAAILMENDIHCIFFGGDVIPSQQACNSEETGEMIDRINADIFFFSCDALSDDGLLTDNSKIACGLRRRYMKKSRLKVLLIDDSKLGKKYTHTLCTLDEVDFVICNIPYNDRKIYT